MGATPSPLLLESYLLAQFGGQALAYFLAPMSFYLHGYACSWVVIFIMFFAVLHELKPMF